jgi:glycosyltransferase involved in cell wall biosynthesis
VRILYLIDSLAAGGAEQSLAALAPRWIDSGLELDVAYLYERKGVRESLENAGAATFCLGGGGGRLGWVRRALVLIVERNPDLVHTTLFEADIAGRIAASIRRVPVVSSLVSVAYGPEQLRNPRLSPIKVRIAQMIDAVTARRVVRFHAVTNQVAQVMSKRLRIPRGRIDVIPRGRDPEALGTRTPQRRAAARAALGVSDDKVLVLAVARHEFPKGLDILLEAVPALLRSHPRARLLIAGGEGNMTPNLRTSVTRLRIDPVVRFLGHREDVPDLLCAADVFVFPSRWEGLPGGVLEAMAMEAPIVASDLPPIRELAPDGDCAVLVPPDRPDALAESVANVIEEPPAARARAQRARSRFLERYTIDHVAHQMLSFYRRALTGG